MSHTWHVFITLGGQTLTVLGILGLTAWLVRPHLERWLRTNIIDPIAQAKQTTEAVQQDVKEVKVATTVNGHSQDEPTLRDDLSDIKRHLARQDQHLAKQDKARASDRAAFSVLSRRVSDHLVVSDADRAQLIDIATDVETIKGRKK